MPRIICTVKEERTGELIYQEDITLGQKFEWFIPRGNNIPMLVIVETIDTSESEKERKEK